MSTRRLAQWLLPLALVATVLGLVPGRADAAPLNGATNVSIKASNSCALVAAGRVVCWGENLEGQVGNGDHADQDQATSVRNVSGTGVLTGATQVTVGIEFGCARLSNGQARCWGRNHAGQLGNGTTTSATQAVVVRNGNNTGPLTDVTQISAGGSHVCARRTNGRILCWGTSAFGQVGYGSSANRSLPTPVLNVAGTGPLEDALQVVSGTQHSCARLENKQVRCWGGSFQGQLGNGSTGAGSLRPVATLRIDGEANLGNVTQLSAGALHTCAVLGTGQARCWGDGGSGQLAEGNDDDRALPVVVENPGADVDSGLDNTTLTGVAQVAAGSNHTCFRLNNKRVRCAGSDGSGKLGNPSIGSAVHVPVLVRNAGNTGPLEGVAQVVAGGDHTCARLAAGGINCWGDDGSGQLGNGGANTDAGLPTVVQILPLA
jgi:alpha-tubulin suppressor-like RCC1 family protein